MLKIIEPNKHAIHKECIASLLDLFKVCHNFTLSSEKLRKATFLVAENNEYGVYGGAVLYPQEISSSLELSSEDTREETLRKLFSAFQPKGQTYWTARICLCIGPATSTSFLEVANICQSFYPGLHHLFVQLGKRKGIDYLTFTIHRADTYCVPSYGSWPYLLEVRAAGDSDGFFHGVLSLNGKKFKVRKAGKASQSLLSSRHSSLSEGRMA